MSADNVAPQAENLAALPVSDVAPVAEPLAAQSETTEPARRRYTDEEIEQLETFANKAYQQLQALDPYKDDIVPLLQDEEYRNFYREAKKHYENGRRQIQEQQKEEIPSWARDMVETFQTQRQREKERKLQEEQAFVAEQQAIARRMEREKNLSREDITYLASYADSLARVLEKRVGIEEAYNHARRFSGAPGAPQTVGLRGDSSLPGIPGQSIDRQAFKDNFRDAVASLLRA